MFFNLEPPVSAAASDPSVSLEDLDASFILSGPFRFAVTDRFDRHLSLDSQNRILIYSWNMRKRKLDRSFRHPFRFDLHNRHFLKESPPPFTVFILISRVLEVDAVEKEMRLTMFLLFQRSPESKGIERKLLERSRRGSKLLGWLRFWPTTRTLLMDDLLWATLIPEVHHPWDYMPSGRDFTMKGTFHLRQFRHYRTRLAYLQEQMKVWKPRKFTGLFTPGYYDRFTWFIAIFGLVFGIIATLSLVTSIIQVVFAVSTW